MTSSSSTSSNHDPDSDYDDPNEHTHSSSTISNRVNSGRLRKSVKHVGTKRSPPITFGKCFQCLIFYPNI